MAVLKRTISYLIVITGAWLLYKAVTLSSFWALLIPALAIFFIVERYSWLAGLISFLVFFLFEMIAFGVGYQSPGHSLICSGVIFVFFIISTSLRRLLFSRNELPESPGYPENSNRIPVSSLTDNYPLDSWPLPFSLFSYAEATDLDSRRLQSNIASSCHYFLELVRRSLDCATVILLRGDKGKRMFAIHSSASSREDLFRNLESRGSGILTPLLQEREEVIVCPVSQQGSNIPYYPSNRGVGSLMAVRVHSEMLVEGKQFILCLDCHTAEPWESWQKDFIRMAARKLGMELDIGHYISRAARNTDTISGICAQLQEMNQVLDLESTYQVVIRSVQNLVECDFVALSLVQGKEQVIVRAEGFDSEDMEGKRFPVTEGLVGQAIKCKHWMPLNATYQGPAPIFSKEKPVSVFKSLFINPLSKRGGDIMGVLTVCSHKEGVYGKTEREMLELICRHVATKIELAQAHERIYRLALTDGLTGLKNHRTFQRGFDNMLQRARRQSIPFCFILSDLDHFKAINDSYGHPFGDEVLKVVARTLQEKVRKVDLVARYGGEEFAMVLEAADEEGGIVQAERIRKAVEALNFRAKGDAVEITMSFGIAVFPKDGEVKQVIIDKADQALYYAKKKGRNRVVPYSAC
ncbi:MAG: sensor domain-containing diguanylate cyclase [Thermodesulfobacteriota bacterium]